MVPSAAPGAVRHSRNPLRFFYRRLSEYWQISDFFPSFQYLSGRILYWNDGIRILADHPLGWAIEAIPIYRGLYQTGVYQVQFIHNEYLQFMLDAGGCFPDYFSQLRWSGNCFPGASFGPKNDSDPDSSSLSDGFRPAVFWSCFVSFYCVQTQREEGNRQDGRRGCRFCRGGQAVLCGDIFPLWEFFSI